MRTYALVGMYLAAAATADLIVAVVPDAWRPIVVLINAFLFIALVLTAGDRLHEAWAGKPWWRIPPAVAFPLRFGCVIAAGAALAYTLNRAAGPVALASCAAFALSATTDRLTYAALGGWGWYARVNGSNAVSALIDSAVFLGGIAYAGLLPLALLPTLIGAQWACKVAGGALWA